MGNFIALFVYFSLIYCTFTCFELALKLFVMKKKIEKFLAKNKDFDNEFSKGVFSGLFCLYTEYFNDKKFLESLSENKK